MKKLITTVAMIFLFSSVQAIAGGYDELKDKYWGASFGIAESDDFGRKSLDDDDNAFRIFGGARVGKKLSVELGYVDFGTFSNTSGGDTAESDGFYFAGVMSLSKSEKLNIYGKAGFMRWSTDDDGVDESGFDPMFGIGASFNFKKNMDIVVDYTLYDVNDSDIDMYSIGIKMQLK